jgi:hypothetical protein
VAHAGDVIHDLCNKAKQVALAAMALGRRLTNIMRGNEDTGPVHMQRSRPPEPEWSRLVEALEDVDFRLASDPILSPVKQGLLAIGRRVNRCQRLLSRGPNNPLHEWGPEFFTEGHSLWEAIRALPRQEPVYAPWAEEEADSLPGPAPAASEPLVSAAQFEPGSTPVSAPGPNAAPRTVPADEEFLGFTAKQSMLLKALYHKGPVPIAVAKLAVYGTDKVADSTLQRLQSRTNQNLANRNYPLEIKRKSNVLSLLPL